MATNCDKRIIERSGIVPGDRIYIYMIIRDTVEYPYAYLCSILKIRLVLKSPLSVYLIY